MLRFFLWCKRWKGANYQIRLIRQFARASAWKSAKKLPTKVNRSQPNFRENARPKDVDDQAASRDVAARLFADVGDGGWSGVHLFPWLTDLPHSGSSAILSMKSSAGLSLAHVVLLCFLLLSSLRNSIWETHSTTDYLRLAPSSCPASQGFSRKAWDA